MVDNLFIVESPLQALVAVELSLQFEGKANALIYRVSGCGRERNDEQIRRIINYVTWDFVEEIELSETGSPMWHFSAKKHISKIRKRFKGNVRNLFFGEFRSHWMHVARFSVAPQRYVLMDDGASMITVKNKFLDNGVFYPTVLWRRKNKFKEFARSLIYKGLFDKKEARKKLAIASAFLREESDFDVDFSKIKSVVCKLTPLRFRKVRTAYFFGSKYSEAGIVSLEYELKFLKNVLDYYNDKGLDFVYCAHRDDSREKLTLIKGLGNAEIFLPNVPAEILVIECNDVVGEIGAAYSSVVNNLNIICPEKNITCFMMDLDQVAIENRDLISTIYDFYEGCGVYVKKF